jgi:glycosyltransferase involved in cell wall biosynthesis
MHRPLRIALWMPVPFWGKGAVPSEWLRRCQALAVTHQFLFLSPEPKNAPEEDPGLPGVSGTLSLNGWSALGGRRAWEQWNSKWRPDIWHLCSWEAACKVAGWSRKRNPRLPVLAELNADDFANESYGANANEDPPHPPDMVVYARSWQKTMLRHRGLAGVWASQSHPALEPELFSSYHPDPRIGRREWSLPEDGFFFVTALDEQRNPGLDALLEAVRQLDRKHPFRGFRLVILHPEAEVLEASITASGLAHRVFVRRPAPASAAVSLAQQRAGLLRSMDVFVGCMSGTMEERTLLEAMAAELPLILVDKPALLELAGNRDRAVFVDEGSSEEWMAAMESMMMDKDKRARLSFASGARARDFSSAIVTGEWVETYGRLLQALA